MKRLTMELKGVRNREWNFNNLLMFSAVVLPISGTIRSSKEIHTITQIQLDLWDQCWAIFRIARPMALRTLAGRREYVGTCKKLRCTNEERTLKNPVDARIRCTTEVHV